MLANAREQVSLLRAALASCEPAVIAGKLPAIQHAIENLRRAAPESLSGSELLALYSELQRTARLIDSGEAFWLAWVRLLGLDTGYTPAGRTAFLEERPARISEQA